MPTSHWYIGKEDESVDSVKENAIQDLWSMKTHRHGWIIAQGSTKFLFLPGIWCSRRCTDYVSETLDKQQPRNVVYLKRCKRKSSYPHVNKDAQTHTHTHTHTHKVRIQALTYIHTHTYLHTYSTYIQTHSCMLTGTFLRVCVCAWSWQADKNISSLLSKTQLFPDWQSTTKKAGRDQRPHTYAARWRLSTRQK